MFNSGGNEWDRGLLRIGLLGISKSERLPDLALRSPHKNIFPLDERVLTKSFTISQISVSRALRYFEAIGAR
jgi:hypothetical protein